MNMVAARTSLFHQGKGECAGICCGALPSRKDPCYRKSGRQRDN